MKYSPKKEIKKVALHLLIQLSHLQDAVTSFSTCGEPTNNTLVRSQNLTPKHSTITATIESQSSISATGNTLCCIHIHILV
jgi:hypothetical protein